MNYINYRNDDGTIEMVEDMRGMSKKDKLALIAEYQLISANYYASSRTCKEYYFTKQYHGL